MVMFNQSVATVTSWSDTEIDVLVPEGVVVQPLDAPQVPVVVSVAGLTSQAQFGLALSTVLTDSLGNQTTLASAPQGGVWLCLRYIRSWN